MQFMTQTRQEYIGEATKEMMIIIEKMMDVLL